MDVITSKEMNLPQPAVDGGYIIQLGRNLNIYRLFPGLMEIIYRMINKKSLKYEQAAKKANLHNYFWPDWSLDWGPRAFFKALFLIRKQKYDVIITNSFPYTNHLVGWLLHKVTGIPWIAELRDGWIFDIDTYNPQTKIHDLLHRWLVHSMLKNANQIWHLTPRLKELFQKECPAFSEKSQCLPFGFDEGLFRQSLGQVKLRINNKLNMSYSGNFYPYYSNPELIFKPIQDLINEYPEIRNQIQFNIIGHNPRFLKFQSEQYGLEDIVVFHPAMEYRELNDFLRRSDLLILLNSGNAWSKVKYSGKLFDYMSTQTPILAIVDPDSLMEELINKTKIGWVAYGQDKQEIKKLLLHIFQLFKRGELKISSDLKEIEKYSLQGSVIPQMDQEIDKIILNDPNKK